MTRTATPTPPDMPELKADDACNPDIILQWALDLLVPAHSQIMKDDGQSDATIDANINVGVAIGHIKAAHAVYKDRALRNTRPTPPADAMMTEHAELRLLVRRLARRLPVDDKTRQQADDYLRRTFKASDVLRDDETVGKPEQTALHPAPVTDAQRDNALDAAKCLRIYRHYLSEDQHELFLSHIETIRAALTNPAQAQGGVKSLVYDFINANDGDNYPFKGEEYDVELVTFAFDWLDTHYHLTPKTQSEE